jgi:hypothetical protein
MGIKVNLTGVEMRSFEPLPLDQVVARLDDVVYQEKSKRSGEPKVQFVMTALRDLKGNVVPGNRRLFYEVSLQDKSLWNLKRTLVALGDDLEDLEGEVDIEKSDYVNRECVAVLYIDDSEAAKGTTGVAKQKVRRLQPLPAHA